MTDATAPLLVLNSGSSSLKFALFDRNRRRLSSGAVSSIGSDAVLKAVASDGGETTRRIEASNAAAALQVLLDALDVVALRGIGHRLVHGGTDRFDPSLVDEGLIRELRKSVPMAPQHLPAELDVIEAVASRLPSVPQGVCFDTAFHRNLPMLTRRLPLPQAMFDRGLRRYGFHGLSCESVMLRLEANGSPPSRIVVLHLGSGCSATAVRDGSSIDTTMGFTPSGGLPMRTRSGDLDPGLILYLLQEEHFSASDLQSLIEDHAGLLALSGRSGDMNTLLAIESRDDAACLAIDQFCYRLRKEVAALAAALGGIDALVFTGGIGEHAPEVRMRVCEGLGLLGIRLDLSLNESTRSVAALRVISASDSVPVLVMPADEETVIAIHTDAVIASYRHDEEVHDADLQSV